MSQIASLDPEGNLFVVELDENQLYTNKMNNNGVIQSSEFNEVELINEISNTKMKFTSDNRILLKGQFQEV